MDKSDKVMFGAFCAMIFFLPISSAMVESLFGVVFVAYLVKRGMFFRSLITKEKGKNPVFLFFEAFKPIPSILNTPISFFLLAAFASIIFSQFSAEGLKGFFFDLLEGVFIFFLFIECVNTQKRLRIFMWCFLASIAIVTLDGISQYLMNNEFLRQNPITDGRITGPFHHANNLGAYLLAAAPITFCLSAFWRPIIFQRKKYINMKLKKPFYLTAVFKLLLCALFFGLIFCIGVTYSRSAWLAFLISMIFLIWKYPKVFTLFIIGAVIFFSIFIFKMYQERTEPIRASDTNDDVAYVSKFKPNLFDPTGRGEYWEQAFRLIQKRPLFGVGLNAYTQATKADKSINWDGYPHNCFIQIMAETGFFGILTFMWILVRLFKRSLQLGLHVQDEFNLALLKGLLCGLLGFLIQAFFDTTFNSVQLSTLLWLLMGMIVSVPKIVLKGEENSKISAYSF